MTVDAQRTAIGRGGPTGRRPHVVVVGGGISGLSAAWFLRKGSKGPRAEVTVLEASERVGGKLALTSFGGIPMDIGAESMLAARPEAIGLCRELGLETVPAATTKASIYSRGALRPIPPGLLTGVPTDLKALARSGVLSLPGLLRIPLDQVLPRTVLHGDVSVGDYVATRLGREVSQRLVDPLLGGVYAGQADELSLQMTAPALYRAASQRKSVLEAARSVLMDGQRSMGPRRGPVFVGLEGGVGTLPQILAETLVERGVAISTGAVVQRIRRRGGGWDLTVGDGRGKYTTLAADAVLFATPTWATSELLRDISLSAADELADVRYADVAVAMLGYPAREVGRLQGSGFLVPEVEGRAVKGVTYSSSKWSWVSQSARSTASDGLVIIRASLGRAGDILTLQRSDEELAALAAGDLHEMIGTPRRPAVQAVFRWERSLPQYGVGHRTRIADVREWLLNTPGLAVCGAAYEGVGIAACIGSAQAAVSTVVAQLAERRDWTHG